MKKMKKRFVAKHRMEKRTAEEHIKSLFELSVSAPHDLADKYVAHARRIAKKFNISLSSRYRRRFCKHCYSYLMPGVTCRVRLSGRHLGRRIVYSCFHCKRHNRFPYGREIRQKRKIKRKRKNE